MTHSGGKPHAVGDRGQRFEVTFLDPGGKRQIFGWAVTFTAARTMQRSIEKHPVWEGGEIRDRERKCKERPILFSGPMVRAIFDGRKTQTRRAIKTGGIPYDEFWAEQWLRKGKCPFGTPGDRLWVRETWAQPFAEGGGSNGVIYRADGPEYLGLAERRHGWGADGDWRPSIHMPKRFARLWLDVKKVRVARLQDMSYADAAAEGAPMLGPTGGPPIEPTFPELWDSLNEKRGHGWDTNPWVWVVEFERANG